MFSRLGSSIAGPLKAAKAMSHTHQIDAGFTPHKNNVAYLRRTYALSEGELDFLSARTKGIADSGSLATFLGLDEGGTVNERDIPIVSSGCGASHSCWCKRRFGSLSLLSKIHLFLADWTGRKRRWNESQFVRKRRNQMVVGRLTG